MKLPSHVRRTKDGVGITKQHRKAPGRKKQQRFNDAGGAVFKLNRWDRLMRFLVLGTEDGSYYVGEEKLVKQNSTNLKKLIKSDGIGVVDLIVSVSTEGRAVNNDYAIYALAMCASEGDESTRRYAFDKLPEVCRIGTHLFHFAEYVKGMRGWGAGLRKALSRWYVNKSNDELALQLLKYRSRDGWTHRDVLRIAHPIPTNKVQDRMFGYVVGSKPTLPKSVKLCRGFIKVRKSTSTSDVVNAINKYRIPREFIPTEFLNDKAVWKALLPHMPMTATIRNLGKMSSLGVLKPMTAESSMIIDKFNDKELIERSRIHPMQVLLARRTYVMGNGVRGNLTWKPNQRIVEALEHMFYASFKNVIPSGKRTMLSLDVSGSMDNPISGSNGIITCREASALMAAVTARTEKDWIITGFTGSGNRDTIAVLKHEKRHNWMGPSVMSELDIRSTDDMDQILAKVDEMQLGPTDCALPMLYALKFGLEVDTFVIYTDNETWAGDIHPFQALRRYRAATGIPAKLVVVAMTASKFSIADPDDAGMLDVVGFDTATPRVISDFSAS